MANESFAYRSGAEAAKRGTHISNCYPFIYEPGFSEWVKGYNSIEPNAKINQDLRDLTMSIIDEGRAY